MGEGERIYYSLERVKPVEKEDVEAVREWMGNSDTVVINFGGADETVNSIRDEAIKRGGKYLVVDPGVRTELADKHLGKVRGSLEQFIEVSEPDKDKFHSIVDDLGMKVDIIEMNNLVGRAPIFNSVGDAMEYFESILKPDGKIVIRNAQGTLQEFVDLDEIESLGWVIKQEEIEEGDFNSSFVQMMGREEMVKVTLTKK